MVSQKKKTSPKKFEQIGKIEKIPLGKIERIKIGTIIGPNGNPVELKKSKGQ